MPDRTTLTAARLRELLHYDPDTGVFTWRVKRRGTASAGSIAGTVNDGYVKIKVDGVRWGAHRLAWFWMTGSAPADEIDHQNGDHCDNRWSNLRQGTHADNMQNQITAQADNRTGLLGVRRRGKRFGAEINANGVKRWLGAFGTAEEAHAAYVATKRELHPFGTL
jgi:hypothetical protein